MSPLKKAKKKEKERKKRLKCIENWICPDCGSDLKDVTGEWSPVVAGECTGGCVHTITTKSFFSEKKSVVPKQFIVYV